MKKTIIWTVIVALVLGGIIVYVKVTDRGAGSNQSSYDVGDQKVSKHGKRKIPYGVTSDSPEATKAGMKVLKNGGNAVDAAIAVSYTLAVTDIYGSGLGGGGLMIVDSPKKDPVEYDYQVTAPKYGDIPNNDVGVPGFVAGMQRAHDDQGSVPMKKLIQPGVDIAENGFKVPSILHKRAKLAKDRIPSGNLPVLYPNGKAIEAGKTLKQPDLAQTLRKIQSNGTDAFYKGEIAGQLAEKVDGFRTKDLAAYKALKKKPVKGKFAGADVYATDPVGGGIPLIQTLQLAEHQKVDQEKDHSMAFIKQMGDINHRIYEDKIHNLGDPDFADVPVDKLASDDHMDHMAEQMKKHPFPKNRQGNKSANKDMEGNTTHFVVVDKNGMMVSATNTLSNFFGSGQKVAGMFLNNELHLFSDRKSSPNYPAPGKRPSSYISPAILAKDGAPLIGIGSAGGDRIPPVISQVLMRMLKFDMDPQEAVNEPRSITDDKEGTVSLEGGFPDRSKAFDQFKQDGYTLDKIHSNNSSYFGSVQTIAVDYAKQDLHIGRDHRRNGAGKKSK